MSSSQRKSRSRDAKSSSRRSYSEHRRRRRQRLNIKGVRTLLNYVAMAAVSIGLAVGLPYLIYRAYTILDSGDYFKIKHIEVHGNHQLDSDYILGRAELSKGLNIFDIDHEKIEDALATDPWISSINVETSLPDTVFINVSEHRPAAILVNGTDWTIVDPKGFPIKTYEPTDPTRELLKLPLISGVSGNELANLDIRQLVVAAINVSHLYRQHVHNANDTVSEIHVDPVLGLTLINNSGLRIRLGTNHFDQRLKRAEVIRNMLAKENKHADYLLVDQRDNVNRITVGFDLPN